MNINYKFNIFFKFDCNSIIMEEKYGLK